MTKRSIKGVLLLVACMGYLSQVTVFAQAQAVCEASKVCDFRDGNIGYKFCLSRLAKEQDQTLNILYRQVRSLLKGTDQDTSIGGNKGYSWPTFHKAQKFWLKFRNHQCEAESQVAHGGTASSGYYANCVCNLTYNRNQDLRRMLSDYGVLGR